MKKAVFIDRDGVVNKKRNDYVKSKNEFILLEGVIESIRLLNKNGFLVIIVTNQSAINRGILTKETLDEIHELMRTELRSHGCVIDAIYYCPHRPEEDCNCRKPRPGLIKKALNDYNISPNESWFIGDDETDMIAAKNAGIRGIRIKTDENLLSFVKRVCGS